MHLGPLTLSYSPICASQIPIIFQTRLKGLLKASMYTWFGMLGGGGGGGGDLQKSSWHKAIMNKVFSPDLKQEKVEEINHKAGHEYHFTHVVDSSPSHQPWWLAEHVPTHTACSWLTEHFSLGCQCRVPPTFPSRWLCKLLHTHMADSWRGRLAATVPYCPPAGTVAEQQQHLQWCCRCWGNRHHSSTLPACCRTADHRAGPAAVTLAANTMSVSWWVPTEMMEKTQPSSTPN